MHRFNWVPVAGFSRRCEPKIKLVKFGDGYQQRSPAGINNKLRTYSASFKYSSDVIWEIDHFLFHRGGVESFLFIPFGEFEERVVVCKSWNATEIGSKGELVAQFEQVVY
ncbi:phage tail protein [Vibrio mediterranei]|jgi:phage-related protein|uniref:Phage tail protein n=1 Tax=Vibrio barjaei TaxID=1676683 RepID=A0ABW7ID29_9VIBR|nr:phage tail protein [Vibrio mediterranei]PTC01985.1 phage tail protein [Vibrio mediterranei]